MIILWEHGRFSRYGGRFARLISILKSNTINEGIVISKFSMYEKINVQ